MSTLDSMWIGEGPIPEAEVEAWSWPSKIVSLSIFAFELASSASSGSVSSFSSVFEEMDLHRINQITEKIECCCYASLSLGLEIAQCLKIKGESLIFAKYWIECKKLFWKHCISCCLHGWTCRSSNFLIKTLTWMQKLCMEDSIYDIF